MDFKVKQLMIDRFENMFAICEDADKRMYAIERDEIPKDAKEGDVLRISEQGELSVDREETNRRRDKVRNLQNKLWK